MKTSSDRISSLARGFAFGRSLLPALALLSLCSQSALSSRSDTAKAAWTVMIYSDADSSLETPQIENVKDMLRVGSTESVQVVLLCDRSPKSAPKDMYTDEAIGGIPDWSGTKLLHVEKDKLTALADWGKAKLSSRSTLTRFLEAGAKAYPAEHYCLIIADHGSGWRQFCADEGSGDRAMNLRDLRGALEPFGKEHGKLDLVGLDACLMASFETAQALEPVAHVMLASEELAPAHGWNYDIFLKALEDKPAMTATDLSRNIIDDYGDYYEKSKDRSVVIEGFGITLSAINLDRFRALQTSVSVLADKCYDSLKKGKDSWEHVAGPRAASAEFGEFGVHGEGGEEEMHDLMHLSRIIELTGDPELAQAAKEVSARAVECVIYSVEGICRRNAGGISIYYPIDGISFDDDLGNAYMTTTFASECGWMKFLRLYSVAAADYAQRPEMTPAKVSATSFNREKPVMVTSSVSLGDLGKCYFVLHMKDQFGQIIIGKMPGAPLADGKLVHRLDGNWLTLKNEVEQGPCPVTEFEEMHYKNIDFLAYSRAQLRHDKSDQWIDVQLELALSGDGGSPHGNVISIIAATPEGPRELRLKTGDRIRSVFTEMAEDGTITDVPPGDSPGLRVNDPAKFQVGWGPLPVGLYRAGFASRSLTGRTTMTLEDVILK